jgi:hypothetical protein
MVDVDFSPRTESLVAGIGDTEVVVARPEP